jgi:hypothetical protein
MTDPAFCRRNVRNVRKYCVRAVHVEWLAARALSKTAGGLARSIAWWLKPFASITKGIFAGGEIPLIAPSPKIGLGPVRQKDLPCAPEFGAGLVERRRGAGLDFTRFRFPIEAANPFPLVGVVRVADAHDDRPGLNVAVINVQAVMALGISAAGKLGHAGIEAGRAAKTTHRTKSPAS